MPEFQVKQNTEEWKKKWRLGPTKKRVGSSDAAAATGVSKYVLPVTLYEHIQNGRPEDTELDPNCPMAIGIRGEPIVDTIYKDFTGFTTGDGNYWTHPYFPDDYGCSPDRSVYQEGRRICILELKTPVKIYDTLPQEHMCQVMFQLWITGFDWCDYAAVQLNPDDMDAVVQLNPNSMDSYQEVPGLMYRVMRSQNYFNWMERRLKKFTYCLQRNTKPTFGTAEGDKDPPPKIDLTLLEDVKRYKLLPKK